LDQNILAPARTIGLTALQGVVPVSAVVSAPVNAPANVPAPGTANTFANKELDTSTLQKTRGLYVTNGATTQKLIDYTEELDGDTKIHALDDDRDGDRDVYYSLGARIFRKENHSKNPQKYFISDAPRVYTTREIYSDFFDIDTPLVGSLFGDAQIDLLRTDKRDMVRYQYLLRDSQDHLRLFLFRSLFHNEYQSADYVSDIVPELDINSLKQTTLVPQPRILDIDGQSSIEHKKIYRTLLPDQKYRDEDGKLQNLSLDFIIRSNQSGYVTERTTLDTVSRGQEVRYSLNPGDRIVFLEDS
jgi:hypothetical protein